jgi:hypothetical protein
MCAVIVAGKTMRPAVVTGLDIFTRREGCEEYPDFIEKTLAQESSIFMALPAWERKFLHDHQSQLLLLDGHGSHLEISFLQYINNPSHEWIVCIGVPYGTS